MNEISTLKTAVSWRREGRRIALARVVQTWGSAPQPVGSILVIDSDGNFEGSVSGGCVEGEVIAEAIELIESDGHKLLSFGVSDEMAWQAGLACGGQIKVFVESIDELKVGLLEQIVKFHKGRVAVALITDLGSGVQSVVTKIDASDEILQVFNRGNSFVDEGNQHRFIHIFNPALKLIIIGAVHISQALVPLAKQVGFDVTVIDPREGFANQERFKGVQLIAEWPDEVLDGFDLDQATAFVALTHDPKIDDDALTAALGSDCFYIGALGSRRTHEKRLERLSEIPNLEKIDAPIGLDIGARGANEIAVSIIAKIIEAMRVGVGH